MKTILIYHL